MRRTANNPAMSHWIFIGAAVILLGAFTWVLATSGQPHPGDVEGQVRYIAQSLRCPQCEWLSAWESNSESALIMREEIREMVLQGMTRDEIVGSYVVRYGESILLMPPFSGSAALAYLLPAGVLVAGFWWLRRYLAHTVKDGAGK